MILVTGGSGFLGRALIKRLAGQGEEVVSISRRLPSEIHESGTLYVQYWRGDILDRNLGFPIQSNDGMAVVAYPSDFDLEGKITAVYHLAGVIDLSLQDKKGVIHETNVTGTRNVVQFCLDHKVLHLYFASTAYTQGRNPYERSKAEAEEIVRTSGVPQTTIFKPSIIIGDGEHFKLEHFSMFALALIKLHRRADLIRRNIEGTLKLPPIEIKQRLKGNPGAKLNMVPVHDVVRMMASITDPGTFWLTNPNPPTIQELADWLGEAVLLKLVVTPQFTASPLEYAFQRLTAAFQPYLYGDYFPSDISVERPITKETIAEMVARVVSKPKH